MPKVSLAGVSTGFEALPEAERVMSVFTGFKNTTSKAKNPCVSLEFTIQEGEKANNGEDLGGRKAFRTFAFTENALWAFKKAVIQLGVPSDDPRLEDPEGMETDEILNEVKGSEVPLRIELTDYEEPDGKIRKSNNIEILDDLSW